MWPLGLAEERSVQGFPKVGKKGSPPGQVQAIRRWTRLQQYLQKQPGGLASQTLPGLFGGHLTQETWGSSEGRLRHSLVALRAEACGLVVLGAVDVGAVVERAVPTADGPAAALVHKVPVEAGVGAMLRAFVLYKQRALLRAEFLQIPAGRGPVEGGPGGSVKPLVCHQEVSHQVPRGPCSEMLVSLGHHKRPRAKAGPHQAIFPNPQVLRQPEGREPQTTGAFSSHLSAMVTSGAMISGLVLLSPP